MVGQLRCMICWSIVLLIVMATGNVAKNIPSKSDSKRFFHPTLWMAPMNLNNIQDDADGVSQSDRVIEKRNSQEKTLYYNPNNEKFVLKKAEQPWVLWNMGGRG